MGRRPRGFGAAVRPLRVRTLPGVRPPLRGIRVRAGGSLALRALPGMPPPSGPSLSLADWFPAVGGGRPRPTCTRHDPCFSRYSTQGSPSLRPLSSLLPAACAPLCSAHPAPHLRDRRAKARPLPGLSLWWQTPDLAAQLLRQRVSLTWCGPPAGSAVAWRLGINTVFKEIVIESGNLS